MHATIRTFLSDESGEAAIEYGFLAVLIAMAFGAGAMLLGDGLGDFFGNTAACFDAAAPGTCTVPGVPPGAGGA
jgi:Flp pilus assembly pilin Flp